MRAAFGLPAEAAAALRDRYPVFDPVQQWAENRGACVEARMQAEAEAIYWDAGQGCAANFPNAEFMEDYCVLDEFCPLYEAGCLDAWLYEHGGNL
jgi:hypothetical protein